MRQLAALFLALTFIGHARSDDEWKWWEEGRMYWQEGDPNGVVLTHVELATLHWRLCQTVHSSMASHCEGLLTSHYSFWRESDQISVPFNIYIEWQQAAANVICPFDANIWENVLPPKHKKVKWGLNP